MRTIAVFGVVVLAAASALGAWRIQQFMQPVDPPAVRQALSAEQVDAADPVGECRKVRGGGLHPPALSVIEEAAVYHAVLTQYVVRTFDPGKLTPQSRRRIIVDPLTVVPWQAPNQPNPWPMNSACRGMPDLLRSTAISFRFANRIEGAPLPRLFALPVPVSFQSPPRGVAESRAFSVQLKDSDGYVRLSRVGFASDMSQALVLLELSRDYGWPRGTFFLLGFNGVWRISDRWRAWAA